MHVKEQLGAICFKDDTVFFMKLDQYLKKGNDSTFSSNWLKRKNFQCKERNCYSWCFGVFVFRKMLDSVQF